MIRKVLMLFSLVLPLALFADDAGQYQVVIPVGCEIGFWIKAGMGVMAGMVAVAIGGFVVFMILKKALRMFRIFKERQSAI